MPALYREHRVSAPLAVCGDFVEVEETSLLVSVRNCDTQCLYMAMYCVIIVCHAARISIRSGLCPLLRNCAKRHQSSTGSASNTPQLHLT